MPSYRMRKIGPSIYVAERRDLDDVEEIAGQHLSSLQMLAKRRWWPLAADVDEKSAITRAFTGDNSCEGCGE